MATAYTPPKGLEAPDIETQMKWNWKKPATGGPSESQRKEQEYIDQLAAAAKAQYPNPDPAIGEVIRTGVADGYAQYVVWNIKPLQLVHIDLGDGWHADDIWIRGLRVRDVREMISREKKLAALFGRP